MTDSVLLTARPALVRRGLRLNYLTLGYVWLDMPGKARHVPEHELRDEPPASDS